MLEKRDIWKCKNLHLRLHGEVALIQKAFSSFPDKEQTRGSLSLIFSNCQTIHMPNVPYS